MSQMENTCKLRAKCLKKDEPLDKCNNPECQNFLHPSCFIKILVTFAAEDWELLWQTMLQRQQEDAGGSRKQGKRKSAMAC